MQHNASVHQGVKRVGSVKPRNKHSASFTKVVFGCMLTESVVEIAVKEVSFPAGIRTRKLDRLYLDQGLPSQCSTLSQVCI